MNGIELVAAAGQSRADILILRVTNLIVNPLIILLFAFSLVVFLWGVFKYIAHADDHEERVVGSNHILWGIMGMAIMMTSFAIINVVLGTFGINEDEKTMAPIREILKLQR